MTWQTKKLNDVIDNVVYTGKIQRRQFLSSGKYPIVSQEQDYINGYWDSDKDVFKVKKPVIIFGDHTQVLKYVDFDFVLGADGVKVLQSKSFLDSKYFYYSLQNINLKSLGYARHFRFLKDVDIAYPESLDEQKRIAKTLDEVFEKLTKAKKAAEKNLHNSKELFESYLRGVFTDRGKGWDEQDLSSLCDVEYGYTNKAKKSGKYRFIRITDTDKDGLLTQGNKMYVSSFEGAGKYILNNGDLLMARTGASAGHVLFFESDEESVFASYLIRIKFKKEILGKLYWFYSRSKHYWDQVRQLSAGSAQPQFNGGSLKKVQFAFPRSLSEQKAIIKKLDALSIETKKLEKIYEQKLSDLEELKKSVLSKAFHAEL